MQQIDLISTDNNPKITLEAVYGAYYACRKNKRRTKQALQFEINLEQNLVQLWKELNDGTYQIGKSTAFLVYKPVIREVFAANFRDRIVHHLIIHKIGGILDTAISRHSFSCRKGMGTLYGVRKMYDAVCRCSNNYTRDCYVLRLDIRAFFMHIKHDLLFAMLKRVIVNHYRATDKNLMLNLVRMVVYNRPQSHCIVRGNKNGWKKLPKTKSLFCAQKGRGLPIGNLTSQIFANFYLYPFDTFVAQQSGIFYGRYVDDMVVIHHQKHVLRRLVNQVRIYLRSVYRLILHPRKTTLQHYKHGFAFVGAFLLPGRIYAGRRLKTMFYTAIQNASALENKTRIRAVINSYLGFLRHYHTFRLRLNGWNVLSICFPWMYSDYGLLKIIYFSYIL